MDYFTIFLLVILLVIYYRFNTKKVWQVEEKYANAVSLGLYYINVNTSTARKQELLAKFDKINLPFTLQRIEAITPNDLKYYSGLEKVCENATEYELACTLSHLRAIFTAYTSNNDYAMIFEDDVIIHRFPNTSKLMETAPSDWEVLQLFTLDNRIYETPKNQLWIPHHNDNFTAAAYLVNRKGMERILKTYLTDFNGNDFSNFNLKSFERMKQFNCAADYVIYNAARTYVCTDLFFTVETKDSTIHTIHLLGQYYFLQKILNLFKEKGYKRPDLGFTNADRF